MESAVDSCWLPVKYAFVALADGQPALPSEARSYSREGRKHAKAASHVSV